MRKVERLLDVAAIYGFASGLLFSSILAFFNFGPLIILALGAILLIIACCLMWQTLDLERREDL